MEGDVSTTQEYGNGDRDGARASLGLTDDDPAPWYHPSNSVHAWNLQNPLHRLQQRVANVFAPYSHITSQPIVQGPYYALDYVPNPWIFVARDVYCGPPGHHRSPVILLYRAILCGDLAMITAIIGEGVDVDAATRDQEHNGYRALHLATLEGHHEAVKLLVSNHASVNVQTSLGFTPLHFAARYGFYEVVNTLVQNNAKVNIRTVLGDTALHFSAARLLQTAINDRPHAVNFLAISKLLIQYGAHVDIPSSMFTCQQDIYTAITTIAHEMQELDIPNQQVLDLRSFIQDNCFYPLPLKCLAAKKVAQKVNFQNVDESIMPQVLKTYVQIHEPLHSQSVVSSPEVSHENSIQSLREMAAIDSVHGLNM